MLGFYRYLLAIMVAVAHFAPGIIWWMGIYAVFCFYLISGYLMTLVLNEVYVSWKDTPKYAINRILRIYPPYLAAMFFIYLIVVATHTEGGEGALGALLGFQPTTISEWISNLTLLYDFDSKLIIFQAWSLRVEMVYYLLMPLLVRRFPLVLAWFAFSVMWVIYLDYSAASFGVRYSTVSGASIAFSGGALAYHVRHLIVLKSWNVYLASALYALHTVFAPYIWGFSTSKIPLASSSAFGLYANVALGAYLLLSIFGYARPQGKFGKFGDQLGNIAYAVFLLHWGALIAIGALGVPLDNVLYYVSFALVAVNIAAVVLFKFIEQPVNRYFRDRIRASL